VKAVVQVSLGTLNFAVALLGPGGTRNPESISSLIVLARCAILVIRVLPVAADAADPGTGD